MTTNVKITVTHLHQGAHVEVKYVDQATKAKSLASRLALGESAELVCHDGSSLLVEEVDGIYGV